MQPDWVKLVLKAISYVTASFCIQFAIPPANCFFVFLLLIKLIKTVHSPQENTSLLFDMLFYNGDRTQWSSIRSLIIRVIKQIAKAKGPNKSDDGSPICLITSMTRPDNYNNICDNKSCFKITDAQYIPVIPRFFASIKRTRTFGCAHCWWRVLSNYSGMTHTQRTLLHWPIMLKSGQLISNQIWQLGYSIQLSP